MRVSDQIASSLIPGPPAWQATVTSSTRNGYEHNRPVYPFIAHDQLTPEMESRYHWLVTAVHQSQAPQQE
ncbi:hypothetical protein [Thermogemmatispora tikiterensis]|uniref:Uncharacterized protein n=1 Tax=Thermogemmatispora tikiterensis TaxID=1825093 RepID=A0A328VLR4_9CHLR|nr:hypothetical protein [Thermogemmatispora tikiterensis]RAQ96094.1 hypothetical protein A4R35_11165 [Thermogemmatispora tikiterensis]